MRSDEERLHDIEEHCELVLQYAREVNTYMNLLRSDVHRSAILHELLIIGEAANHVSPTLTSRHSEISWREITDLRNVVAHDYFGIDWPLVWETSIYDVPKLLDQVRAILTDEFGKS